MSVYRKQLKISKISDKIQTGFLWALCLSAILLIISLLFMVVGKGLSQLSLDFFYKMPEELDKGGGISTVLFNSFYMLILSLIFSIPIGIGSGIYLAEYAPDNKLTAMIRVCVEGLASVPSIVFGLFGLAIFVEYFEIGLTILGGAVSLGLLNLPVLTRVTEEAVRAVPEDVRSSAIALGATKFQTIMRVVIPSALTGIMTGISLVAGRAYGESAVIILAAGTSTSGVMWDFSLFAPGETLAVHLWYVQSEAIVEDASAIAEKSAAVLLLMVLLINLIIRVPAWLHHRKLNRR
ncbi:phosphate ABC transporter permease PstA [Fictibacillus iocasae]|uniref:Phosphate transport system permease protein PstA n=1 Tax=Fictibacillus iocasae TaxID=2715437 RepID=A0ABW2NPM8_9BACL